MRLILGPSSLEYLTSANYSLQMGCEDKSWPIIGLTLRLLFTDASDDVCMNTWFGILAAYPRGGQPGANLCPLLEGTSRGGASYEIQDYIYRKVNTSSFRTGHNP